MLVLDDAEMEFQCQFYKCRQFAEFETSPLVQTLFLRGIAPNTLDVGSAWGNVYTRHTGMKSPKPLSTSQIVLKLVPTSTRCQNENSSHISVIWPDSCRDAKFWRSSRNLLLDARSDIQESTNEFCFLWIHALQNFQIHEVFVRCRLSLVWQTVSVRPIANWGSLVLPASAANCLWIVFLLSEILFSLTFVVLPGIN